MCVSLYLRHHPSWTCCCGDAGMGERAVRCCAVLVCAQSSPTDEDRWLFSRCLTDSSKPVNLPMLPMTNGNGQDSLERRVQTRSPMKLSKPGRDVHFSLCHGIRLNM
ncbi:hypothetical protein AALO_G00243340 [Alosa alosa]|uniref:Uncharacterized protein n=1 Tax=Alosa alosa TaxID=278164 RepID=A0AAV6FS21_9TELE|nr:hypothetical protein AALO_G00243340 [Alosa alosa]